MITLAFTEFFDWGNGVINYYLYENRYSLGFMILEFKKEFLAMII